jgi:hypothetical protein
MDENGAAPRKPNRGQFQKGQSGNPGGRKPIPADLKEAMRGLSDMATKVLQKAMSESLVKGQPSTRTGIMAALAVHDRGYGKPAQTINAKVEGVDASVAHLDALRDLMDATRSRSVDDDNDPVTH